MQSTEESTKSVRVREECDLESNPLVEVFPAPFGDSILQFFDLVFAVLQCASAKCPLGGSCAPC